MLPWDWIWNTSQNASELEHWTCNRDFSTPPVKYINTSSTLSASPQEKLLAFEYPGFLRAGMTDYLP